MATSDELIRFDLDGVPLVVTESTVANVTEVISRTGLHTMSIEQLYDSLMSFSHDGIITIDDYNTFVHNLISKKINSATSAAAPADPRSYTRTAKALLALFRNFDRTDSGCVDAVELISGLSVLCEGYVSFLHLTYIPPRFISQYFIS